MGPLAVVFQCTVKALYDYRAQREDELCFPKQALILNVDKQEGGWWVNVSVHVLPSHVTSHLEKSVMGLRLVFRWRGDYGGKKQLWFPANYVEEVPSSPVRELDEAVSSDSYREMSVQGLSCFSNYNQYCFFMILLSQSTENSPLGTFLKGFIDVPTCHVGESHKQTCSWDDRGGTDHMCAFFLGLTSLWLHFIVH